MFSVLSQLFVTERHRPRAGEVGVSVPAYSEVELATDVSPLLATNMRGTFIRTRVSSQGVARFGFSECPLDKEPELLVEFYKVLVATARAEGWGTCTTIDSACQRIRSAGLHPKIIVAADVGTYEDCRVVVGPLPPGSVIVVAQAEAAGNYTRIGDYVGILAQRIDKAFAVVVS